MVELVVFVLMAGASILGSLTVIRARNPVYAAMGLLATLFSMGVLYVLNLAHFVAAVQIIVYAGAVMTLFLFVIMLIGVDKAEDLSETIPHQRRLAMALGLVAVGIAVALVARGPVLVGPGRLRAPADPQATNGTVQAIAEPLFGEWVLAFEATALLLTIAAAGAIALASHRRPSAVRRAGDGGRVSLVVTPGWYMTLAAILFGIGALGILVRRNALVMFMCIELMLNAVNLTFIAAGRALGNLDGQLAVFFVLVVAAAEVVVGLAIIVAIFRLRQTASVDDLTEMKG